MESWKRQFRARFFTLLLLGGKFVLVQFVGGSVSSFVDRDRQGPLRRPRHKKKDVSQIVGFHLEMQINGRKPCKKPGKNPRKPVSNLQRNRGKPGRNPIGQPFSPLGELQHDFPALPTDRRAFNVSSRSRGHSHRGFRP